MKAIKATYSRCLLHVVAMRLEVNWLLLNLKAINDVSVAILIAVLLLDLVGVPFISDNELGARRAHISQVFVLQLISQVLNFFRHALQNFLVYDQAIGLWHQLQVLARLQVRIYIV